MRKISLCWPFLFYLDQFRRLPLAGGGKTVNLRVYRWNQVPNAQFRLTGRSFSCILSLKEDNNGVQSLLGSRNGS